MASFSSKMVNLALMWRGVKDTFESEEAALKGVEENRKAGPAKLDRMLRAMCHVKEEYVDGNLVYHMKRKTGASDHHVLYFHGGGYALDIMEEHWKYLIKLIRTTGAWVTVPIYPKAPENDWKPAYDLARKLYADIAAKTDSKNICLMGDSAGGGFSLALAQMLRDDKQPMPGRIVLLSPWLDGLANDPEQVKLERRDLIIALPAIQAMGRWWAGKGGDPAGFPVSPINGDITGLPPMAVWSGTSDILYTDAKKLKAKAKADGVELETHFYADMQHVWMLLPMKEADQAIGEITRFIKRT